MSRAAVDPGWPQAGHLTFSPAVVAQDLIFVSGMTATNDRGDLQAAGDIVGQTRIILGKLERVLEAAGATMADVVQTTDYILTADSYRRTADVRREFFVHPYPAATGIIVAGLLRVGALIEIDAIAVRGRS